MAYLRLTLLRPRPGAEEEMHHILSELDTTLADAPGMMFSMVLGQDNGRLGRVSVWQDKEEANKEATSARVLSLRSRLRFLSLDTEETLLQVASGYVPAGFGSLLDAAKQPVSFPFAASQPALPG